jgi:hypothetical protein
MIEESLALFRQVGDKWGIGDALGTGGLIALGLDQPERGLSLMQESVDVKREVGDRWGASAMLGFGASVPLRWATSQPRASWPSEAVAGKGGGRQGDHLRHA